MEDEMELEEVVIPQEDNREDDDELDDVIPCSPISIDSYGSEEEGAAYFSRDGFYDEEGYTPSTSIDDMVDIPSDLAVPQREDNLLMDDEVR